MNEGAYRIDERFLSQPMITELVSKIREDSWVPTHSGGSYADAKWRTLPLIKDDSPTEHYSKFSAIDDVVSRFPCKFKMMTFYSILPGGKLHPHRDLSGASILNCMRFHIPLVTNELMDFRVSKKRVIMKPGELWALDTSYLHSVNNAGSADRIHIVMEVEMNDWVRELLPRNDHRAYIHKFFFYCIVVQRACYSFTYNLIFRRDILKNHFRMASSLLKHIFKIGKSK
jgi:hypothetical protein